MPKEIFLTLALGIVFTMVSIGTYNRLSSFRVAALSGYGEFHKEIKDRHRLIKEILEILKKDPSAHFSSLLSDYDKALEDAWLAQVDPGNSWNLNNFCNSELNLQQSLRRLIRGQYDSFIYWSENEKQCLLDSLLLADKKIEFSRVRYNGIAASFNAIKNQFPSVVVSFFSLLKKLPEIKIVSIL